MSSNLQNGDIIICVDNNKTLHLTKNKQYKILNIHDSIAGTLIQLISDCDEIYSFEQPRFVSLKQYRDEQLEEIFA